VAETGTRPGPARAAPEGATDIVAGGATVGTEIEIKLKAAPDVLREVWDGPLLTGPRAAGDESRRLDSTYYDTADHALRRRGVGCRVRFDGERYVQTVKARCAEGAVHARREWQWPVAGGRPDFTRIDDPPLAEALGGVTSGDLAAVFRTRVERATRRLDIAEAGGGAIVEAALDIGGIVAGRRRTPIAEIELELLEGAPSALYNLARSLIDGAPLSLELRSKAARGYALVIGGPPPWTRGPKFALSSGEAVADAVGQIVGGCLAMWTENEAAACDGSDPEGVHQMRVALRRLRSAVTMFRCVLSDEDARWLNAGARRIAHALGPARDWDVFATSLLAPVMAARLDDRRLKALARAVERARSAAYRDMRALIDARDYARFLIDVTEWLDRRAWKQVADLDQAQPLLEPVEDFAARELDRRRKKVRRIGRQIDALGAGELHRLRLALKKLRYGVEFFGSLYPRKPRKRYRKAAAALQDALGHLNDVAAAEMLIATLGGKGGRAAGDIRAGAQMLIGWHLGRMPESRAAVNEAWLRFDGMKPFWR